MSAAHLGEGGGPSAGEHGRWPPITHPTTTTPGPIYGESIATIRGTDNARLVDAARARDRSAALLVHGLVSVRVGRYEPDEIAAEHAR